MSLKQKAQESANFIGRNVTGHADLAIILGSGLGSFLDNMNNITRIPYSIIPNFPLSTVEGHIGELIFGFLGDVAVWAMNGRLHYYESYSLSATVFPLRVLKLLGVKNLIVSNAAGGLNPEFEVGHLMLITDQIDLFSDNPLRGGESVDFGVRFPDMSEPYNLKWQQKAKKTAHEYGIALIEGVYIGVKGPSLETKAEIKRLRIIGGDAVGMSTVPEVIVANQMGMNVLGFSVITNQCLPLVPKEFTHDEVVAVANRAGANLMRLVKGVLQ